MMFGSLTRAAALAGFCAMLAGCGTASHLTTLSADLSYADPGRATTPISPADNPTLFPDDDADSAPATVDSGPHLECVPYARDHSTVNLHGDAYTWWDKAAGVYARGNSPLLGAVMVLVNYAGRRHAHVAVVRRIISPREIRIDHANWLNDGAIYVNDPVIDVSADNDWTQIKVWNIRKSSWGTRVYAVKGFIGPGPVNGSPLVASYVRPAAPLAPRLEDPIALQIVANGDPIARQIAASDADLGMPSAR
jgi:hypothetical protein